MQVSCILQYFVFSKLQNGIAGCRMVVIIAWKHFLKLAMIEKIAVVISIFSDCRNSTDVYSPYLPQTRLCRRGLKL